MSKSIHFIRDILTSFLWCIWMPSYKLSYWDGRGYAEPIRFIFHQAGVPFEDVRLDFYTEFTQFKSKTPMGQLPVMEVDGKMLCQSSAIARYLAKEFNLAGKSAWEQAQADMIVDGAVDCRTAGRPYFRSIFSKDDDKEERTEKAWNTFKEESVLKFLETYTKLLGQNKSGWFVGDSLTWADLVVGNFAWTLDQVEPTLFDDYPQLKQHQQNVFSLPKIAEWVAKRPDTIF